MTLAHLGLYTVKNRQYSLYQFSGPQMITNKIL